MGARSPWRISADDYERLITGLCGVPPGPYRDECIRSITGRLLAIYARYDVTLKPGLLEFAERIGVIAGEAERDGSVQRFDE